MTQGTENGALERLNGKKPWISSADDGAYCTAHGRRAVGSRGKPYSIHIQTQTQAAAVRIWSR
jgi:hypothetical protein